MRPHRRLRMPSEQALEFLSARHRGVLTTLGPEGWPHSVGMYYVVGDGTLRTWTYAASQKARNLERDPRCSLLVEEGEPYSDLRGVLVRGRAALRRDRDEVLDVGVAVYERCVRPLTGLPAAGVVLEELRRQAAKRVAIELPLDSVVSYDHARARMRVSGSG